MVLVAALALFAASCGDDDKKSSDTTATGGGGKAGFIWPDSAPSARWEAFDRPLIQAACDAAGIECLIQNAEGDKDNMATIADQMIADGRAFGLVHQGGWCDVGRPEGIAQAEAMLRGVSNV